MLSWKTVLEGLCPSFLSPPPHPLLHIVILTDAIGSSLVLQASALIMCIYLSLISGMLFELKKKKKKIIRPQCLLLNLDNDKPRPLRLSRSELQRTLRCLDFRNPA